MPDEIEMELSGDSVETPAPAENVETPSQEDTPTETPAEDVPVTVDTDTPPEDKGEPMLYDTPDGRKVTAEQLQKEWKENFLPDYTRKSQELAEIKRAEKPDISAPKKDDVPYWEDPEYVPQSYAEVIKIAKEEAKKEFLESGQKEAEFKQQLSDKIESELTEIKAIDPTLDENQLFEHANKYGFNNLKSAHSNMKAMKEAAIEAEQRTLKNLDKRKSVPVAGPTTEKPVDTGDISMDDINSNMTPLEYYRSLKGK